MGGKSDKKLIVKGKRLDGRKLDEMRPISAKVGVVPQAEGSAKFTMGETVAIAAVYGPKQVHPRRNELSNRVYLEVKYSMVPFSTSDRIRPGPNRRSSEISKVMTGALEPAVFLEKYPQTGVYVHVNVVNANAGTRTAALNAASLALADAGIEMRDLVVSVAAGKVDGQVILDLAQEEDNFGEADLPVAYMPNSGKITLLQMDGDLSKEELSKGLDMCKKAAKKIYEIQKNALLEKYKNMGQEANNEK